MAFSSSSLASRKLCENVRKYYSVESSEAARKYLSSHEEMERLTEFYITLVVLAKYSAAMKEVCGDFSEGWTYDDFKRCEVRSSSN